jgi:UDP-N-acetylmuramoyl-tripeptide--D-alanyl-D-alanine ligase
LATEPPSGAPGFWTFDRVADALASVTSVNLPSGDTPLHRVWTDTRSVRAGDLFVALSGERFDAHDFIGDAVARGAAAVVVARDVAPPGVPVFNVDDTLVALGALASYRRMAWGKPVVMVVGSVGKTSTKDLLRAVLEGVMEVDATAGNLNNLIGVPLTLLGLRDEADIAVVEAGTNQPGEIARIREMVNPDATVVTWIAEEHLEGLGDLAGVLREEMAACTGVPLVIAPAAQQDVVQAARAKAGRVVTAGLNDGDVRPESYHLLDDGRGRLMVDGAEIDVPLRGTHNLRNAMLAVALGRELGISPATAASGIAAMATPPMRVHIETHGGVTVINDAYNANPASMRAALELLGNTGAGRQRVAVLGSMLEMGAQAPRLHEELLREALGGPADLVAVLGDFQLAAAGLTQEGGSRLLAAPDPDALWRALSSRLSADAVILLKGSRGVRMERLIPLIAAWATSAQSISSPVPA